MDFDFEMRLYFLPEADWPGEAPIEPKMIQCNAWGPSDDTKSVGVSRASFSKLSEEKVLSRWEGAVSRPGGIPFEKGVRWIFQQ